MVYTQLKEKAVLAGLDLLSKYFTALAYVANSLAVGMPAAPFTDDFKVQDESELEAGIRKELREEK